MARSPRFHHIGVLVTDLEEAIERWSRLTGWSCDCIGRYRPDSYAYSCGAEPEPHGHDQRISFSLDGPSSLSRLRSIRASPLMTPPTSPHLYLPDGEPSPVLCRSGLLRVSVNTIRPHPRDKLGRAPTLSPFRFCRGVPGTFSGFSQLSPTTWSTGPQHILVPETMWGPIVKIAGTAPVASGHWLTVPIGPRQSWTHGRSEEERVRSSPGFPTVLPIAINRDRLQRTRYTQTRPTACIPVN